MLPFGLAKIIKLLFSISSKLFLCISFWHWWTGSHDFGNKVISSGFVPPIGPFFFVLPNSTCCCYFWGFSLFALHGCFQHAWPFLIQTAHRCFSHITTVTATQVQDVIVYCLLHRLTPKLLGCGRGRREQEIQLVWPLCVTSPRGMQLMAPKNQRPTPFAMIRVLL